MAQYNGIVYLSPSQFDELTDKGSIVVDGKTIIYDENTLYVTPENIEVPTKLSELENDTGFITEDDVPDFTETDPTVPSFVKDITEQDIDNWNNKSDFSGSYNDLTDKPEIPSISGLATETYVQEYVASQLSTSITTALNTEVQNGKD